MRTLFLAVMLTASVALADATDQTQAPEKKCHQVCVKPKPRVVKPRPKHVVVVQPAAKPCCGMPQNQQQTQSQQVIVNVGPQASVPVPSEPVAGIGVRVALGLHTCDPALFGQVGVRARVPSWALGLDVSHQFAHGVGAALLLYPVQGPLSWHLDLGILTGWRFPLSSAQVERKVDLSLGTGLELNVVPRLSLTADWRWSFPEPGALGNPRVDAWHTLGNSLHRSQLLLGLMLHTW